MVPGMLGTNLMFTAIWFICGATSAFILIKNFKRWSALEPSRFAEAANIFYGHEALTKYMENIKKTHREPLFLLELEEAYDISNKTQQNEERARLYGR